MRPANHTFSKDHKILLFASARSGSNSLTAILNQHPLISLMYEPFNEFRKEWAEDKISYKKDTKTIKDLDRALEEVHQSYNGLKTLSYQLPKDLTEHLLVKKGYTVVFLYRENHLKSVISRLIAVQTNIWTTEQKEKQQEQPKTLASLDIKEMRKEIESLKNNLKDYLSILKEARIPFIEVSYEELFTTQKEEQIKKIEEIFTFLGFEMPIDWYLSSKRKITDNKTYNLIPNIQEIEKELGSEENGFLFT